VRSLVLPWWHFWAFLYWFLDYLCIDLWMFYYLDSLFAACHDPCLLSLDFEHCCLPWPQPGIVYVLGLSALCLMLISDPCLFWLFLINILHMDLNASDSLNASVFTITYTLILTRTEFFHYTGDNNRILPGNRCFMTPFPDQLQCRFSQDKGTQWSEL